MSCDNLRISRGFLVSAKHPLFPAEHELRAELTELPTAVDQRFPENVHADIVEGQLVLRRNSRADTPSEVRLVDQLLSDRLSPVSILDVLIETVHWLRLHRHFRPLEGAESRA